LKLKAHPWKWQELCTQHNILEELNLQISWCNGTRACWGWVCFLCQFVHRLRYVTLSMMEGMWEYSYFKYGMRTHSAWNIGNNRFL
jgi:hypothetical protein